MQLIYEINRRFLKYLTLRDPDVTTESIAKTSILRFRLSDEEIEAAIAKVSRRDLDDIAFAQDQVRNFAERQKSYNFV